MKKLLKTSFILLALLGVLFTSCKKEYEIPPIPVLPEGQVYTIGDLLALPSNTTFDTASVYGIVTADEQSGNLYKTIFIQDRASGKAIELLMSTSSAARIGDSVRVFLDKNMMVNNYHNLPQLVGKDGKGFNPDGHLIIYPYNKPIEPSVVTIADIKSGNYLAGLVKLENVEFVDQGSAFCNVGENTNRTLKDATGDLLVRTSNYANFAYDMLPVGQGSLVAIASVYNNDWQLILRSTHNKADFYFEGGTPTPPSPPGEVQHLPYTQSFASEFGTYTTFDVLGEQSWMIDYSTAKITGHIGGNPGEDYANEDWLISSPVDLSGVSEVTLTMTYIGRYFTNINNEVTLWASTNYTYGNDPTTVQWTQLPAVLSEGSNWTDFLTAEIAVNSQLISQTVTFAVKYTSTDTKAGTVEIQSIAIAEGGSTPPPQPGGELQSMPYSQSFATDFGSYMTYDVEGPQMWSIDFSTAKMTGYASGTNYVNEDWLISSPVAVTGVDKAKVAVTYVAQYQNSDANDVTLQVSTDYVWGNPPSTANWTQMPKNYPNTGGWQDFQTVETSLNDYIGQNITVAIKFTSTESQSRTIEVQSITVQEGEAGGGDTPPIPIPGTPEGSGTAEDPYNVAAAISLQSEEPVAWVHGYIVGAVKSGNSSVSSNDQVSWSAPFDLNTNVLIADDPDCHEVALCVIVNLPNNKPLRTQVNLVDHPENLGKMLAVTGKLRTYFGQAGLRDSGGTVNDFVLEGGETPPAPPTNAIFSETFATGQGDFVVKDVLLPDELNYVWAHDPQHSCMKASAYVGHAYETESWLVSPAISLADVTTATLKFDQAVNYLAPDGVLSVWVTTDFAGSVDETQWTELVLSAWPAGNNWTFVTSTADLSSYAGQTVYIAFKYTSTDAASATWELQNLVIE